MFNNLNYAFSDGSIVEIEKDSIVNQMKEWFISPFQQEPKLAVLFFKKSDCQKTNLWIKHHCLNNGKELAAGDLLIANANIYIPDETGFGNPKRILNGMYFTVIEVLENRDETISIKGYPRPILLSFTKIFVKCLSLNGQNAEIWVLDNYLNSADELSKEEQIAVNIFLNRRVSEQKKLFPFIESGFYRQLTLDLEYQALSGDEKGTIERLIQNRMVPKEDKVSVNATKAIRSLLKRYYDKYENWIQRLVRERDPLVNVLYAKYTWAITVHKAVGAEFENVILKGFRTENDGICSEAYFRWLYSGVSASAGIFYIAQPQYVHPFMNCVVGEIDSGVSMSKQLLIYDEYTLPTRFAEIITQKNINVSAAISELAKILEPQGYILKEMNLCSDFLTKAIFSIPQSIKKKLVIDFHNKGAKDSFGVSAIKMKPNESVDAAFIKQSIETVFSQNSLHTKPIECPDYIMEVVNIFVERMEKRGIRLETVSSKDYQIICKATSDNGNAMLRLWYGTSSENHSKGFINKIEVFDITDTAIASEVRQMRLINQ